MNCEASAAATWRFQFQPGADGLSAVLHDVKTETAVLGLAIEADPVISHAKNQLSFSPASFQNNLGRLRVFVRIDHAFAQNSKQLGSDFVVFDIQLAFASE